MNLARRERRGNEIRANRRGSCGFTRAKVTIELFLLPRSPTANESVRAFDTRKIVTDKTGSTTEGVVYGYPERRILFQLCLRVNVGKFFQRYEKEIAQNWKRETARAHALEYTLRLRVYKLHVQCPGLH